MGTPAWAKQVKTIPPARIGMHELYADPGARLCRTTSRSAIRASRDDFPADLSAATRHLVMAVCGAGPIEGEIVRPGPSRATNLPRASEFSHTFPRERLASGGCAALGLA
jgi:hypothetical protein